MTHVYRFSRGALIEWRTAEGTPAASTLRPRSQQVVVARGQGRARVSVPPVAVATGTVVNATVGNAVADGEIAGISAERTIDANIGGAVAAGRTASISVGVTISCGVGAAQAIGWHATIISQQFYSVGYGNLGPRTRKAKKRVRKALPSTAVTEAPKRPLAPLVIREEEVLRHDLKQIVVRRWNPPKESKPPSLTLEAVWAEVQDIRATLEKERQARRQRDRLRILML